MPEPLLHEALLHLSAADPVMARLVGDYGECGLGLRERDPFHVLATSIIGQQLSTRAAATIRARVEALTASPGALQPRALLAADPRKLRQAGLSTAKARWLQALSALVLDGEFSFAALEAMDDERAIRALDALPGVGRWTAEMFLIFALNRADIFSLGDAGLRRAMNRLYNHGLPLTDETSAAIALRWRPYRSIASRYLWRLLDDATPVQASA